ncbi:saccharopine dehydrogenase NADP-binding domain-containing protein [Thermopolyspora sp. NPDC052614]|uniref:saccharopine dehydrogenase family protein n=1 Tax=Thermopolyspora sp. NPDC052614 TaxID=3155682 RepID=UPI00341E104F
MKFDIVVFGATGYTGRLVAEHLAMRHASGEQFTFALAGRSLEALEAAREAAGAPPDTPLLLADAARPATLHTLVANTRSVITTVGPYQLYGSELVAACVASGTDYLDLCGEPGWMRQMIQTHHESAVATGARILFACGFDSVPSEIGVWLCQRTARDVLGAPVPRIKGRVRRFHGALSGGTAATIRATMSAIESAPSLGRLLTDPFALTPGFQGPPQPTATEHEDDSDVGPTEPFMLGAINRMSVHRSNLLQGHAYGTDFVYDEMALVGAISSPVEGVPFAAGEGPTRQQRDEGSFDLLFIGKAADGRQVRVSVSSDKDPGYGSTAQIIGETALCLLHAPDVPGGMWTPVAALQDRLLRQLRQHTALVFRCRAALDDISVQR